MILAFEKIECLNKIAKQKNRRRKRKKITRRKSKKNKRKTSNRKKRERTEMAILLNKYGK